MSTRIFLRAKRFSTAGILFCSLSYHFYFGQNASGNCIKIQRGNFRAENIAPRRKFRPVENYITIISLETLNELVEMTESKRVNFFE